MFKGDACNDNFPGGITNGAHWYSLSGGMQDYNYHYTNCFEITLELSCCKYPWNSTLKQFWSDNKDSLIAYMQQVHSGVKGIITRNNTPIANATIRVLGNKKVVKTTKDGEYWRLLMPGKYLISVGHCLKTVTVQKGKVARLDLDLNDTFPCATNKASQVLYKNGFHLMSLVLAVLCRALLF